ncbi:MAG: 1-deoxy-D-xylulose-5-phosphate synthase [Blautia sp.]|nr:1-deoxy-D-xylulose-5-phosphate synthase [Blautia sp.]
MILEKIQKPNDIHQIPLRDFPQLADEIRDFILQSVSRSGGHLASNLGTVELTLALHNVLTFPQDKLVWDVGHQAYTHKILTGRKEDFATLRQEGGLSGFPKRSESDCDAFDSGHSSNSISAGLGMVYARDLCQGTNTIISVIGDGALTGGLAFEAMNNAAELETNFIIVLNDNNMSIARNIGGLSSYLSVIRTAQAYTGMKLNVTRSLNKVPRIGPAIVRTVHRTKSSIKQFFIPGMLFENMGLTYIGPVDGHDMRQTMRLLNEAKRVPGPVIVHVLTQKGHGYEPACRYPEKYHGIGPFDIKTGEPLSKKTKATYTDIFSQTLCQLGKEKGNLTAVTAAMPEGTGLKAFQQCFPSRFFDVGIAEGHAVSFAAGLALGGLLPVVAIYSSFLQRAVDQLMHDVCMQRLHILFAIDRSGFVGADGETHHGCFDLSYLSMMPNMTVMAPKSGRELTSMLWAAMDFEGPVAVRYSKDEAWEDPAGREEPIRYGKAELLKKGKKVAVLAVGSMVSVCLGLEKEFLEAGIDATFVNMRFIKPMDTELLDQLASDHELFVTVEENVQRGGMGEGVCSYLQMHHPHVRVKIMAIEDRFVPQASVYAQRRENGLSGQHIKESILSFFEEKAGGKI